MLYRAKTDLSARSGTFMATVSGIPARTKFRTALLLKSWGTLPRSPASWQAFFRNSLVVAVYAYTTRLPLRLLLGLSRGPRLADEHDFRLVIHFRYVFAAL